MPRRANLVCEDRGVEEGWHRAVHDVQRDGDGRHLGQPLEVALVVDVSGSMAGAPLEAAKEAAARLASGVREEDSVTLITFDSEVKAVCELQVMTPENRERVVEAIGGLESGSMTALHGGWKMAAKELVNSSSDALRRIVLLSDGHANIGITSPHSLGREAAKMAVQRGDFGEAASIMLKAGQKNEAVELFKRAGDTVQARSVSASVF